MPDLALHGYGSTEEFHQPLDNMQPKPSPVLRTPTFPLSLPKRLENSGERIPGNTNPSVDDTKLNASSAALRLY